MRHLSKWVRRRGPNSVKLRKHHIGVKATPHKCHLTNENDTFNYSLNTSKVSFWHLSKWVRRRGPIGVNLKWHSKGVNYDTIQFSKWRHSMLMSGPICDTFNGVKWHLYFFQCTAAKGTVMKFELRRFSCYGLPFKKIKGTCRLVFR